MQRLLIPFTGQNKNFPGYLPRSLKSIHMERLHTLIDKFREQLDAGVSADRLLLTVQMLQSELLHLQTSEKSNSTSSAHIDIPSVAPVGTLIQPDASASKVVEVLTVDEKALEAELDEIRQNAQVRARLAAQAHQPAIVSEEEELPVMASEAPENKTEVHQLLAGDVQSSLNDRFLKESTEVAQVIEESVIKDLRKGIAVNDRFVFINELFKGDDNLYEKSIKTINAFKIYAEAEFWIRQELKANLGWVQDNPLVRQFDQLIRRRFACI